MIGAMTDTSGVAAAPAHSNGRVIGVSVVAALGGFLFGFDSSVINAAVPGIAAQTVIAQVTAHPNSPIRPATITVRPAAGPLT